jgi:hypothetical protein
VKRSSIVPLAIVALTIVAAIGGWLIYWPIESQRYAATRAVSNSPSVIRLVYTVTHQHGPIGRETLTFTNNNGKAKVAYEGTNHDGTLIARFTQPVDGYEVAKLFGETVRDGVWDLRSVPPRGDTSTTYTVSVFQLTDNKSGSHTFSFTDPHYWATTAGRQYHIQLSKDKPVPDILKLDSTSLAEPRFQKVVADFSGFNAPGFRATLTKARTKLRAG